VICPTLLEVTICIYYFIWICQFIFYQIVIFHKTLSTKFLVAPKSTKVLVCTFLPYIQSITRILKEVFLLHAILLQDSSTTFKFFELIEYQIYKAWILVSLFNSLFLSFFFLFSFYLPYLGLGLKWRYGHMSHTCHIR